jgi:hypothetical protein
VGARVVRVPRAARRNLDQRRDRPQGVRDLWRGQVLDPKSRRLRRPRATSVPCRMRVSPASCRASRRDPIERAEQRQRVPDDWRCSLVATSPTRFQELRLSSKNLRVVPDGALATVRAGPNLQARKGCRGPSAGGHPIVAVPALVRLPTYRPGDPWRARHRQPTITSPASRHGSRVKPFWWAFLLLWNFAGPRCHDSSANYLVVVSPGPVR